MLSRRLYAYPIFIVGMGRSGTMVLLQSLGYHPLILTAPGEAILVYRLGGLAHMFSELNPKVSYYRGQLKMPLPQLYDALRRMCFESIVGSRYGLQVYKREILQNHNLSILKKRFWCAKTFPTHDEYHGLMNLYPQAKFIYIIRDGMSVVQSRVKFSGGEFFEHYCHAWVENLERYNYLTEVNNAIEVRHEQLVVDPVQFFNSIFEFLKIDAHTGPIEFTSGTIIHPLDKPTQEGVNVQQILSKRQPPYQTWTEDQKEMFKCICGQAMLETGYDIPF